MRLLICTQAVDRDDPALGFFHRWIEGFAAHADKVIIICLRKGNYELPKHVEVIALGEKWRFLRALEVCSIAFGRRADYDALVVPLAAEKYPDTRPPPSCMPPDFITPVVRHLVRITLQPSSGLIRKIGEDGPPAAMSINGAGIG